MKLDTREILKGFRAQSPLLPIQIKISIRKKKTTHRASEEKLMDMMTNKGDWRT